MIHQHLEGRIKNYSGTEGRAKKKICGKFLLFPVLSFPEVIIEQLHSHLCSKVCTCVCAYIYTCVCVT